MQSKHRDFSVVDRIAFHVCWICGGALLFCAGVVAAKCDMIPNAVFMAFGSGYKSLTDDLHKKYPFSYIDARDPSRPRVYNASGASDELNLITRMGIDGEMSANIVDMAGRDVHRWIINWFKIWPDAKHLPGYRVPKSGPGSQIDGVVLLENGNLIFNFEYLGLVCLDINGNVQWRLPYQTHHSVTRSEDGNLWVCGYIHRKLPDARVPNWQPSFMDETILEITPEGEIIYELSVIDLLRKNGKEAMLYLRSPEDESTAVSGDVLHLNDVEPFPSHMKEGFFKKGDIMLSLRNINTVLVFSRKDEKIKFLSVGPFVRQHDPDFIDGNTISVFDNYNVAGSSTEATSAILIVSAPDQKVTTYYRGTKEHPFYTRIMGKHTWLPNGNLLIAEPCSGRAIEINREKEIVWEYNNYTTEGYVGYVQDVMRIPSSYASLFNQPTSQYASKRLKDRFELSQRKDLE